MEIVPARSADKQAIKGLLDACALPHENITPRSLEHFLVLRNHDVVVGVCGLDLCGDTALLRSLAVSELVRKAGAGKNLVAAAEALAWSAGVRQLYLLTTTAEAYFRKLGYTAKPRGFAPAEIQGTAEFSRLCPTASTLMVKIMDQGTYNVLFLCTGNSTRSIMAEALLNTLGKGRFKAYSAGSFPAGAVNPLAIEMVKTLGYPTEGLRSKSWDEFAQGGAPMMDFVFTVCDKAAGESCPVWPGHPISVHWGFEDPAAEQGSVTGKRETFEKIFMEIKRCIQLFLELPIDHIERMSLQNELRSIADR